jgi:hypothetical protein
MRTRLNVAAVVILVSVSVPSAQSMSPGMSHEQHQRQMQKEAELKKHGLAAMGFEQDAAAHHFRLYADGGAIEVEARHPADDATRAAIRAHLRRIADDFAHGDFAKPLDTHGEVPPGVSDLVRLRSSITYRYDPTPNGGRVGITTANSEALSAVYLFLKYQIREHGTGDSQAVTK